LPSDFFVNVIEQHIGTTDTLFERIQEETLSLYVSKNSLILAEAHVNGSKPSSITHRCHFKSIARENLLPLVLVLFSYCHCLYVNVIQIAISKKYIGETSSDSDKNKW